MKPEINCKLSVAEFLDRLTILYIKRQHIFDFSKQQYIELEIKEMESSLDDDATQWLIELMDINKKMWDCNEKRKLKIEQQEFDDEYLSLTIEESKLNDERFLIKARINNHFKSSLKEQKSYEWLKDS